MELMVFTGLIRMVFRWLFIPWLQKELDSYRVRINNSRKRHDKNKVGSFQPDILSSEFTVLCRSCLMVFPNSYTQVQKTMALWISGCAYSRQTTL